MIYVDIDTLKTVGKFFNKDISNVDLVYKVGIPRLLKLFEKHNMIATFFVVGNEVDEHKTMLKRIVREGHKLGNHTYSHPFGMTMLSRQEKYNEIYECHKKIKELGVEPIGFRAPGYDIDTETINILKELGYSYDTSVFPSPISILMKLYAKLHGGKTVGYGQWKYAFSKTSPYFIDQLLEIPITTFMRIPLHTTMLFKFPILSNLKIYPITIHGVDLIEYNFPKCPTLSFDLSFRLSIIEKILRKIRQINDR